MDLGLDIAGLTSNEVSTQAARASKTRDKKGLGEESQGLAICLYV